MQSTSYLPDFSVLASVPDAGGGVEDAELEVCPLHWMGKTQERRKPPAVAQRGGGWHRSQAVLLVNQRSVCHLRPPGMVREPYASLSSLSRVETPHPGMKILSLLGKVVGVEGRAAWLSPTGLGSTLQGSTIASAPWKDEPLTARSATYPPRREAPFLYGDSRCVVPGMFQSTDESKGRSLLEASEPANPGALCRWQC